MRKILGCCLTCLTAVGATLPQAQTAESGNAALNNSGNNAAGAFRVTVGPDDALSDNAEALELLRSLELLVSDLVRSGDLALTGDGAASLSDGLVEIAKTTAFPDFMIFEDQFTLTAETTHILRDGQTTLGLRGFHQSGPMLDLNGEDIRPRTGGTVEFQFGGEPCRLINNAIDKDRDEATFTVIC